MIDFEGDITPIQGYTWMVYDAAGSAAAYLYTRTDEPPSVPEGYTVKPVGSGKLNADIPTENMHVEQVKGLGTVVRTYGQGRLLPAVRAILEKSGEG